MAELPAIDPRIPGHRSTISFGQRLTRGYVTNRQETVRLFHGQPEDWVRGEPWAGCSLIAMAHLFANADEAELPSAAGNPPLGPNSSTACGRSASL